MAQLQQPFNAQVIDPTQGGNFKPLMLGKYPCVILASEIKGNKNDAASGQLVLDIQAIAGEQQGKEGQWIINLYHKDDQTRNIAEKTLSAICHATGQFLIHDSSALHNLPFAIDVVEQALSAKQQEDKANGKNVTPFRNVRVLMADGSEITASAGGQPQQQQPAAQTQQPATTGGWGAAAGQQQPAQATQQPAAGAWGGGGQVQQPAAQQPAATGWAQGGAAAGGQPAWGKK